MNIRLPQTQRTGYTFDGWYEDNEYTSARYDAGDTYTTILTENKEFYAKWNPNGYELTFEYNGATSGNAELTRVMKYGQNYGTLPNPEIDYKVTYKPNDGTDEKQDTVTTKFQGWYKEATFENKVEEDSIYDVNGDQTLYAKWGETKVTIQDINSKEGHTFEGWYETSNFTGTKYNVGDVVNLTKSMTLYANWKGIDFTVTYDYDGATSGNITSGKNVTYNGLYGELPSPEKEFIITFEKNDDTPYATETVEYEFGGWYLDSARITMIKEDVTVTTNGDHTIYAEWYPKNTLILPYFAREGYTFSGWYKNSDFSGEQYNPGEEYTPEGDTTFYLKWTQNTLTVEYETNGGNTVANTIVKYGEEITLPTATKKGYTLEGWYRDEELTDKITEETYTVTDNATLYAKWKIAEYAISYNLDGGTVEGENPEKYNIETDPITLIAPTKEGYEFTGWTGSNGTAPQKTVTIPKGSTGNKTYTASWKIVSYTISYALNGGTAVPANPATYTSETNSFTLTNPTRSGYTFAGWTGTDVDTATETVTINKGSKGNRSYTATWEAIEYTITYDLADGGLADGVTNPEKYTIETNSFTLTNPTRAGYAFTGWTGSNGTIPQKTVTINKGSKGNRTYTANWSNASFTISYSLNGGSVSPANPTTYTAASNDITLRNPTRANYVFDGWTGTDLTEKTMEVTIPQGSTGNRTYTAYWVTANYSLKNGTVTTYYLKLQDAINNATNPTAVITVLKEMEETSANIEDKTLTINTNNKTITISSIDINENAEVTINGNGKIIKEGASTPVIQ